MEDRADTLTWQRQEKKTDGRNVGAVARMKMVWSMCNTGGGVSQKWQMLELKLPIECDTAATRKTTSQVTEGE